MPKIQSDNPVKFLKACMAQGYKVDRIFLDIPFDPTVPDEENAWEDIWRDCEALARKMVNIGGWVITPVMPHALVSMLDIFRRWAISEHYVMDLKRPAMPTAPWLISSHQYYIAWGKDIDSECETPRSSMVTTPFETFIHYVKPEHIILEPNGSQFEFLEGQVRFYLGSVK